MTDRVFGWWVICDDYGTEVHRVEGHHPVGSSHHERAERGLLRRIADSETLTVEWRDAR